MTSLFPFLPVPADKWSVRSAVLGLAVDATCEENLYNSNNLLKIKDLEISFESEESWVEEWGFKILSALGSTVSDEVALEFPVTGNLAEPEFDLGEVYVESLQESVMRWATLQALRSLGAGQKGLDK